MTNQELRQLCELGVSTPEVFGNANVQILARQCLRLLAENEAMRGVVEAAREIEPYQPGSYGIGLETAYSAKSQRLRQALSKLESP